MKRTERREQKQAARQRIYHLQAKLRKEPQRVPERVVNGSHQVAVKWKGDAARIPGLPHVIAPPPDRTSLNKLLALEARLQRELEALT